MMDHVTDSQRRAEYHFRQAAHHVGEALKLPVMEGKKKTRLGDVHRWLLHQAGVSK